MPRITKTDPGLVAAIKAAGGLRPLSRKLKLNHSTLMRWTRVPYQHIVEVEQATGVPRERLRPELYRKEKR